jgi:hypothetical protein
MPTPRRLAMLQARGLRGPERRRYCFYFDEEAEAQAQGLPYVLVHRIDLLMSAAVADMEGQARIAAFRRAGMMSGQNSALRRTASR